jgi:hypothetical protein
MKNKLLVLIFSAATVFYSCRSSNPNDNVDEGQIQENTYTSAEIGWTVTIPKGWTVIERNDVKERNEKGVKAASEVVGEIDMSSLKNLIAFEKDKFNSFVSSSEPFFPEKDGDWKENSQGVKQVIYDTYTTKGMRVDTTATTVETVDGRDFEAYGFTLYKPEGGILLQQKVFSRWANGATLTVALNYNNNADGDVLLRTFRESKFAK